MRRLRTVKREVTTAISKSHNLARRRPRLGVARFDSDHHQRQDPAFVVRRAVPTKANSSAWTSPYDVGGSGRSRTASLAGRLPGHQHRLQPRRDRPRRVASTTSGVGSRDAVVLAGELAELLRPAGLAGGLLAAPDDQRPGAFRCQPRSRVRAGRASGRPARGSPTSRSPSSAWAAGCPATSTGPTRCGSFSARAAPRSARCPPSGGSRSTTAHPKSAAALARTTRWGSFLDDIDEFDAEFFEHLAARSRQDGPPAAAAARGGLGGAGARRDPGRTRCGARRPGFSSGACVSEYGYLALARPAGRSTPGATPAVR